MLHLLGLPDAAVEESTERVRAAIVNSGLSYPSGRLTVNLAPADLRKEGAAYDLPIAVALLILAEQISAELEGVLFLGELSLEGSVRHVNGILPMAHLAHKLGYTSIFVPQSDAPEAALEVAAAGGHNVLMCRTKTASIWPDYLVEDRRIIWGLGLVALPRDGLCLIPFVA